MDDVASLAVGVLDERDARGAVRIVLDLLHRRRHAELVAPEIDDAVLPLVAAASTAHGDVTVIVAAAALFQRLDERLLRLLARDLREIRDGTEPCARRDRSELTNRHSIYLSLRRSESCRPRRASRRPSSSWDDDRRSCRAASPCRDGSTSTRPRRVRRRAARSRRGSAASRPLDAPRTCTRRDPDTPPSFSP